MTGGSKGEIILWSGNSSKSDLQVHTGVVHCIRVLKEVIGDSTAQELCLSGGKDGKIVICGFKGSTLERIREVTTPDSYARAIDLKGNKLLFGMRNGRIAWKDLSGREPENKLHVIIYSHHEGEVWGLCEIPGKGCFVTSGDDNKMIRWDVQKK